MFTPDKEGIDHINVYTKSNTELGRLLSNLANTPINHPKYGFFACLEALWYWLVIGKENHEIKDMNGFEAKKFGQKNLPEDYEKIIESEEFRKDFKLGIRQKMLEHKNILAMLVKTKDLPLAHYYYYTPKDGNLANAKVIMKDKHQWQLDYIEEIRQKTIEWQKEKEL
ncbi:MAG: hypothetical protein CL760_12620 [Chloroflexi bacterium]|nr:hypothetical protein [Chloroflexota bacterium]|tara:strand:- start:11107 stop:11610 length:504 start_codon:yes stop_codon:yes gene_type:complete